MRDKRFMRFQLHRPGRAAHPATRWVARASASVVGLWTAVSWAQPLPEGDTGIAAQYPNDANIGSDAAVLFHEDFEAISDGSLTYDNSNFDAAYGENVITQNPPDVHGGLQAVERTHSSPGSFGAVKYVGSGHDTLHIRFYMKFHPDFPGCHHTGGGIYAVAGSGYTQIGDITGVRPDGTNHYQAWLDTLAPFFSWNPTGNDIPPGWLHFYCYNMDQDSEYGDHLFSDGMIIPGASGIVLSTDFVSRPNFNPERGRWASYEVMMTANTPGSRDGRIAFWVDGQLMGDFPGLRLRSTNSLRPNHVAISTYSSEVHANKTLWYDDVVAASSYIGPMFDPGGAGSGGAGGSGGTGGSSASGGSGGSETGGSGGAAAGAGGTGGGLAGAGTPGLGADDTSEDGCGCRAAPASTPHAFIFAVGLLSLLGVGIRSRRHQASGRIGREATATPHRRP